MHFVPRIENQATAPPTEAALLLFFIVALLLLVLFPPQIARQLLHACRSGLVFCAFRHALRLIYLPLKGTDFVRSGLKHHNETSAFQSSTS